MPVPRPSDAPDPRTASLSDLDDDALAWLRDTVELRVASLNTRMNPPPADRNRHNALRWEATQARKVASALGTSSPVTN